MSAVAPCCRSCGSPTGHKVDVWFRGEFLFSERECLRCREVHEIELALLRGEFHALLDRGVERKMANRIMEVRVDELFRKGVFTGGSLDDAPADGPP